jgi:hypothetical protein
MLGGGRAGWVEEGLDRWGKGWLSRGRDGCTAVGKRMRVCPQALKPSSPQALKRKIKLKHESTVQAW